MLLNRPADVLGQGPCSFQKVQRRCRGDDHSNNVARSVEKSPARVTALRSACIPRRHRRKESLWCPRRSPGRRQWKSADCSRRVECRRAVPQGRLRRGPATRSRSSVRPGRGSRPRNLRGPGTTCQHEEREDQDGQRTHRRSVVSVAGRRHGRKNGGSPAPTAPPAVPIPQNHQSRLSGN
jgi:hypothetical protein